MADAQISQLGPLFPKLSLLDGKTFDFAGLSDCDDYSAQDAGVLDEKLHRACTWLFRSKARLLPSKTWKDVLHSQENRQK